ncbi:TssN family type VI secretion system protein [Flavobacterium aquidurense]|uniref:TssN family type VI secretion system protein n=1 Tax=Flavobacterium aquidurense TaxID=362413 RepID=UPI00285CFADD|nr:TssN family type VI secretion system protein [Flavobacterium aquidurense]MDR7371315.1 hypothetical protein [Flavobacterium aquidurense]
MIKTHLADLIDIKLIVFLVIIIALCGILTLLLLCDKVKDFSKIYKKEFYIYIFSFVLIYAVIAFLGYNKLFSELSAELLFYQLASLTFGILHVWLYRNYFKEFGAKNLSLEILFVVLVMLYSSILFSVIYTAFSGINYTFLMCGHFLMFLVPTAIYSVFEFMVAIPPRKFITWEPKLPYAEIEGKEMEDILLITLLIRKEESDEEYASIRTQAPLKVDFGRLFYLTLDGYNRFNQNDQIELTQPNGQFYNWFFYLQPKWNEKTKYVDAGYYVGLNGITENSVVICQRETEKNTAPVKKKKPDQKVISIDELNKGAEKKQIDSVEKITVEKKVK